MAQASRTWVSGVGDDANPCSRTAPCKTFAGAISKTAAGGEINCLDSAGFGAVTITKAMQILCDGVVGGTLTAGQHGITVNAGANDIVFLSGLDFNGNGTAGSFHGIRFLAGKALHVRNSVIRRYTGIGILFQPAGNATLVVQDTVIAETAGGILVKPGAGANAIGSLTNTRMDRNTFGLRVEDRSKVSMHNSTAFGNATNGIVVVTSAQAAEVAILNSTIVGNTVNGVATVGAPSTVHLHNSKVFANGTGINFSGGPGSTIAGTDPDTNLIIGNGTNGTVNGNPLLQ
jgi:hypothetical protein